MDKPQIPVSLPSLLRPSAGGLAEVTVEADVLEDALEALFQAHPLLRRHLFDERGGLRQHVDVFLNDRSLRWLDDWNQPLRAGDTLTVLQAVSGG